MPSPVVRNPEKSFSPKRVLSRGNRYVLGHHAIAISQVIGPEAFQGMKRLIQGFQISLSQHPQRHRIDMTLMQGFDPVAQVQAFFRDLYPNRAAVMGGAFLLKIAVFNHLFDVIGDI